MQYTLTPNSTFSEDLAIPSTKPLDAKDSVICVLACLFFLRNASLTVSVGNFVFTSPIFMVPPKSAIAEASKSFSKDKAKNSPEKNWISNLMFSGFKVCG